MWGIPLKMLTLKSRIDPSPFNLLACLLLSVVLSLCCCESGCCLSCSCPPSPLCVSAKPFVTAVKGPSSERQSAAEHGLHVLGSDRLCHGHPQQAGPARHPAPGLPQTRGKPPHTWQPATEALRTDCIAHSIKKKLSRTWNIWFRCRVNSCSRRWPLAFLLSVCV